MLSTTRFRVPMSLMEKLSAALLPTFTLPMSSKVSDKTISGAVPVPEAVTVRVLSSPTLLVIVTVAVSTPKVVGLKVTVTAWLSPGVIVTDDAVSTVKTALLL